MGSKASTIFTSPSPSGLVARSDILDALTSFQRTHGDTRRERYAPRVGHHAQFVAALLSGGDSRVAIDPCTGTNKYACPPTPAPDLVCFSSCTASPISWRGFERADECYDSIAGAVSPRDRAERLQGYRRGIEDSLLRYFGAAGLADVILCPSGTDALLTAATILAAERPGEMMTAILSNASETGTGVPLAAAGRWFDGPATGTPLPGCAIDSIQVPLRTLAGAPRSDGELNGAFISAAKSARVGRLSTSRTAARRGWSHRPRSRKGSM